MDLSGWGHDHMSMPAVELVRPMRRAGSVRPRRRHGPRSRRSAAAPPSGSRRRRPRLLNRFTRRRRRPPRPSAPRHAPKRRPLQHKQPRRKPARTWTVFGATSPTCAPRPPRTANKRADHAAQLAEVRQSASERADALTTALRAAEQTIEELRRQPGGRGAKT